MEKWYVRLLFTGITCIWTCLSWLTILKVKFNVMSLRKMFNSCTCLIVALSLQLVYKRFSLQSLDQNPFPCIQRFIIAFKYKHLIRNYLVPNVLPNGSLTCPIIKAHVLRLGIKRPLKWPTQCTRSSRYNCKQYHFRAVKR